MDALILEAVVGGSTNSKCTGVFHPEPSENCHLKRTRLFGFCGTLHAKLVCMRQSSLQKNSDIFIHSRKARTIGNLVRRAKYTATNQPHPSEIATSAREAGTRTSRSRRHNNNRRRRCQLQTTTPARYGSSSQSLCRRSSGLDYASLGVVHS